jgi:molybdenum cofactor biosynthesis protein B
MGVEQHRHTGRKSVRFKIITVSDTRGSDNDPSGDLIAEQLVSAGHQILGRQWVPDEIDDIRAALVQSGEAQAIILTGGTGTTDRDVTWRVVQDFCDEPLPAFSILFAQLSYAEVGAAAMLSRACAGVCRAPNRVVFALPGSKKACRLALEKLLIPEISHLIGHLQR